MGFIERLQIIEGKIEHPNIDDLMGPLVSLGCTGDVLSSKDGKSIEQKYIIENITQNKLIDVKSYFLTDCEVRARLDN